MNLKLLAVAPTAFKLALPLQARQAAPMAQGPVSEKRLLGGLREPVRGLICADHRRCRFRARVGAAAVAAGAARA